MAVTDDAGTASPLIMDTLRQQAIEVSEIAEYRATYDDIFTTLVQRHRDAATEGEASAEEVAAAAAERVA